MPGKAPTRRVSSPSIAFVMTVVFAATVQIGIVLIWQNSREQLGRLKDWTFNILTTLGFSTKAAMNAAPSTSYVLLILIFFVSGLLIGAITRSDWRRFALVFAITVVVATYFQSLQDWQASARAYGWRSFAFASLFVFTLVCAPSLLGAWLASHPRERRRERLRAAGLCEACGYNLISITSGICPECGLKTARSAALSIDRAPDAPP